MLVGGFGTVAQGGALSVAELTALSPARVWIGLTNSDAVGLRVDLQAEVFADGALIGAGVLPNVATGSSGFNNARLQEIPLALTDGAVEVPAGTELALVVSVRRTCSGGGHNAGTVRLWYDGQPVDTGRGRDAGSRFDATIDGAARDFFLRSGFSLSEDAGTSRVSVDAAVNSSAACPDRSYLPFVTWSMTFPTAPGPVTFAVLSDTPFGDAQRSAFPALVNAINADPTVGFVLHAGNVKSGSSTCDDARFVDLVGLFNTFVDPFVLTPGDNEWTDCHRTAAGGFLPTERLEAVRRTFFPDPRSTLGAHPMPVMTQADEPDHSAYRENVLFQHSQVVFATVHVVGSENDLEPWAQLPGGDRPDLRLAEFEARKAAALDWIDAAFDLARLTRAAGVLLMMHAEPADTPGFADIRARIVSRSREFGAVDPVGRPVLLVHGGEGVFEVEPNYAGVTNLTRLGTFGDTATQWLRVTADPGSPGVFSWTPETVP
jgi:hypothetical protein